MSTLSKPLVIVNLKTYLEGTGRNARTLAQIATGVTERTGVNIALAPQFTDLALLARDTVVPLYAQHIDPITPGSHTGHILPEAVRDAGAVGTLINHSERRLPFETVEAAIQRAREVGLLTCVCADTPRAAQRIASYRPDIVAVEPPELIGTGIPVSQAQPEVVTNTVTLVREVNTDVTILCGAGITKGADVAAALQLGTEGVLIASGIVKAADRRAALLDLVAPLQ
jgi:triosephosphate isomerase